MSVDVHLIKALREKTGAGVVDCQKALRDANSNIDDAIDLLRERGMATAAKKTHKVAADGLVSITISDDGNTAAILEINSETDFVASSQKFQDLVVQVTNIAIKHDTLDSLLNAQLEHHTSVQSAITNAIATLGENVKIRRLSNVKLLEAGIIGSYVHNKVLPSAGKIGVVVAISSNCAQHDKIAELAKHIAMHTASSAPVALKIEDLDKALVQKERDIIMAQLQNTDKPANIIEKMIDGKMRQFYATSVLMEQTFIMDNKITIADLLKQFAKEYLCHVAIKSFVRFEVGQGIVVENMSLSESVAQML